MITGLDWISVSIGFAGGVAVMAVLSWQRSGGRKAEPEQDWWSAPAHPLALPTDVQAQVLVLRAQGKTIEAVKLVRERMGCGLKEAKDAVDTLR